MILFRNYSSEFWCNFGFFDFTFDWVITKSNSILYLSRIDWFESNRFLDIRFVMESRGNWKLEVNDSRPEFEFTANPNPCRLCRIWVIYKYFSNNYLFKRSMYICEFDFEINPFKNKMKNGIELTASFTQNAQSIIFITEHPQNKIAYKKAAPDEYYKKS